MRRIVFTGGGTGGHIIPNIAIIQKIRKKYPDIEIIYIGSKKGPESTMIPKLNIKFESIPTGKLRRYFSLKNFIDLFRIPMGILKARKILRKFKPHVVFSKGGYVSLPVIYAAKFLKIPSILHESDVNPGLANKLSSKKVSILCLSHYESQRYFPKNLKKVITGNPVRENVLKGNPESAYKATNFSKDKPVILIMGGSQGAKHINEEVLLAINELVRHYQLIHICGEGKIPEAIPLPEKHRERYKAFEYVDKLLADFYTITDLVIARAGANTIAEIEALGIPSILIPIAKAASRGEQLMNALVHQEKYPKTKVIEDELLNYHSLIRAIKQAIPYENFEKKERMQIFEHEPTNKILNILDNYLGETCLKKEEKSL